MWIGLVENFKAIFLKLFIIITWHSLPNFTYENRISVSWEFCSFKTCFIEKFVLFPIIIKFAFIDISINRSNRVWSDHVWLLQISTRFRNWDLDISYRIIIVILKARSLEETIWEIAITTSIGILLVQDLNLIQWTFLQAVSSFLVSLRSTLLLRVVAIFWEISRSLLNYLVKSLVWAFHTDSYSIEGTHWAST